MRYLPLKRVAEKTRTLRKDVKLGNVYGNRIAIIEGLQQGEQVITMGAQQVRSGQEVSILH